MAEQIDRLKKLALSLKKIEAKYITQKGHRASGKLINSLRNVAQIRAEGWDIKGFMNDYGIWLDRGRRPGETKVPVSALVSWLKQKGISSGDRSLVQIAFAIQTTIFREGSSTRGAQKFSNLKGRNKWLTHALQDNSTFITQEVKKIFRSDLETEIKNFADFTVRQGIFKRVA